MLVLYPGTDTARQEVFITPTPPIAGAATLPSGYKTLAVTVPATPYARVKFGYDASFHCTTDADSCVTGGTPWSYLREAPASTSCVSGCTINVPAIPGKVLYYLIEQTNSSGALRTALPTQVAIP